MRTEGEATARSCEPGQLVADGGSVAVHADTLISRAPEGPFAPLAIALERNAAVRDAFVRAIPTPSLAAWSRVRLVLLAVAAVPLLMLLELDRELVMQSLLGPGRLCVDLLAAAFVVFELTRRSPRMPAVAAAALLAVAMRWALVAARLCGTRVHPAVWAAATLAVGATVAILARAPSRGRVALELLDKLGITRADANAIKAKLVVTPPRARVVAAVAAAVGLPLLLWVVRRSGAGVWPQAGAFVVYAVVVPEIFSRIDRSTAKRDRALAGDGERIHVVTTLFAIALGLTLTSSLLYGTHQFFEAGGELARCTGRLDEESRRLLAAETRELLRRVASVRSSTALVLITTAVMPLAEERIFRGLLMSTLVKKYGFAYGLFASAAAFGVAHVGVYELALYQTVLLGIGFGLAYAEGGIIAAFVVHGVWNLLNVA